jgi:hypothetical protein
MKALKTVQELWSHCLFCPICQDITRDVHVEVGPDDAFQLVKFEKNNHILTLHCSFRAFKKKQSVKYHINCLDNSFKVDIGESTPDETPTTAARPYFFFYIQSDCKECNSSHTNGSDLELDMLNSVVSNIGVEREGIYLLNEKNKFHITLCHDDNEMLISKCFEDEQTGEILDDNKPFNFPIIEFDFSNQKKVINKIRTLLVFS